MVLEMGTAMGWDHDGCKGTEDTKDWARVQNIINPPDNAQGAPQRARQIASWKSDYSGVPLHWATLRQAPLEVVAALLKAFPEGAKEKDNYGNLPLHLATQNQAPLEVVAALLKAFPEGAKEKNSDGDLPLHYATENHAPLEVVAALLKAFPEGAKEKNIAGDLPLQQMAFSKPLFQTLSRIIWQGRHPLPRACLSVSLLHPLQEFAVRISCDHAAAVEFKLCIFSARNSEHHPLRHFVSVGYANAHARIESFLFPKTAVRRSMSQMLLQLDQAVSSLSLRMTYSSIAALSLHPGTF